MAGAVTTVRVLIADDERPARRYLAGVLSQCEGAELVGEAASGFEAVELITTTRPDLALLDLQMPELGGFEVVRRLPRERLPMVAFVTAYDDFAVEAFELSALHYVLKPAQVAPMNDTLARARTHLDRRDAAAHATSMAAATATYERLIRRQYLDRIPVRRRDDVVFLQTRQVAFIVAEGELLHLTSVSGERFTIAYRLHALEARLDPRRFIRLGRGSLVNLDFVTRVSAMPGGTYRATLVTGDELPVSRIRSRWLRESLLRL